MEKEIWKESDTYPYILVSNKCMAKTKEGIILNNYERKNGYLYWNVYHKVKGYITVSAHKVVAEAFLEPVEGKNIVIINNGIRNDIRPENLKFGTRKQVKKINIKKTGGIRYPIEQLDKEGNVIAKWESISQASKVLNIDEESIRKVCKGRKEYFYNCYWRYEKDPTQDDLPGEIWKQIEFNGKILFVSNKGRVKGMRGKIVKGCIDENNYVMIRAGNAGIHAHVLVARAFIPNPENKRTVDHKNENTIDNNVENLRWATYQEQQIYRSQTYNVFKGRKPVTVLKPDNSVFDFPNSGAAERYYEMTTSDVLKAVKRNGNAGPGRWMYTEDYNNILEIKHKFIICIYKSRQELLDKFNFSNVQLQKAIDNYTTLGNRHWMLVSVYNRYTELEKNSV